MTNLKLLNIILADDDEDDRQLFKKAMESAKVNIVLSIFNDGQALMDYLNAPDTPLPQVVFLDLNMPVKNGMDCLKEIRNDSRFNEVSIAIYSTSSSEKDIAETFINGANIYINKPSSFTQLKEALAKVVEMNWHYHTSKLNKDNFLLRI